MPRRDFKWWYEWRYDQLVMDGFTPEEAGLIANTRISSGPIRLLRRRRKRSVQRAMNTGLSRQEAIELVRANIRGTDNEILTWEDFRRIVYPRHTSISFAV